MMRKDDEGLIPLTQYRHAAVGVAIEEAPSKKDACYFSFEKEK